MRVIVTEVDHVGAAGEGAEGRSAGGDLGGGGKGREQEKNKKQIPRCARDDSRYLVCAFHSGPNALAARPELVEADWNWRWGSKALLKKFCTWRGIFTPELVWELT